MTTDQPETVPTGADLAAAQAVASRMAVAAAAWLESLDGEQTRAARRPGPDDPVDGPAADEERRRWFYTPADHGGLTLGAQRPAQQQRAMQLVATGLSEAGYVTVAAVMGLENVLDRAEGWSRDWGWERGRDPSRYWLRVFGDPGTDAPWGWRFGGHHVSVNVLVVDRAVVATTPCFLGADPATSPLLGGGLLRPLGAVEDLARELVRSLDADRLAAALLAPRAPTDIVGANRSRLADGDRHQVLATPSLWGGEFAEQRLTELIRQMTDTVEAKAGSTDADHAALALGPPKGLPVTALDGGQRQLLRALLDCYLGRVPDELRSRRFDDEAELDAVHLAWAGSTEAGGPHYYRLQAPRFLVEWDNTQRNANHAHSVWRDPEGDFGDDVLAAHRAAHHPTG
jgi:hypothetical protein